MAGNLLPAPILSIKISFQPLPSVIKSGNRFHVSTENIFKQLISNLKFRNFAPIN